MIRPGLLLACSLASAARLLGQTDPFETRVELLFRPLLAEQMALSPDGRRVAYTRQAGNDLQVIILDVENPLAKVRLNVDEARTVLFAKEKQHAQLRFLRWATADRLVMAPTEVRIMVPTMPPPSSLDAERLLTEGPPPKLPDTPKITAPIMAVDATGLNPTELADASPEATIAPPINGFLTNNRERLVVLFPPDEGGRVTIDVRTGKKTELDDERPLTTAADGRFPFPGEARIRAMEDLARKFPHRTAELLDWTEDLQYLLVHITGGGDPGRVFVYQRPLNLMLEVFRNAPWLNSSELNETRAFEVAGPDGTRLSGCVTWPRAPRLKPPPLLVCFPTKIPGSAQPDFDPESQLLADLGFVVLRPNHRFAKNFSAQDRAALRTGLDRISVDDAAAMVGKLAELFPNRPFDAKHIATLGRGFGGYVAVRALQLRPDVFHAGIAIDAPMDLRRWLYPAVFFLDAPHPTDLPSGIFTSDSEELERISVANHAASLTRPVMFIVEPSRNATVEMGVSAVRAELKKAGHAADYLEAEPGFALGLPKACAAVYRKIEEFINLRLYDYRVKIGPSTEVK